MIKLIIFDFNGVATTGGYAKTMPILAKRYKVPLQQIYDVFYTKYLNLGATNKISEDDVWRLPVKHFGIKDDWRKLRKLHLDMQNPQKRVVTLANKLRKNYQVIMLTKNISGQLAYVIKRTGMDQYFDEVINTQTLNLPKASKKTMRYIMKKFSVKPKESIYIDDQEDNLKEAKKVGIRTILYANFRQFKKELSGLIGKIN